MKEKPKKWNLHMKINKDDKISPLTVLITTYGD